MDTIFHYLDILIGFAMVMLIASSMVTVITGWFMGWMKYRSQILAWGLQQLLSKMDPRLSPHAKAIVEKILIHPLVADLNGAGRPQKSKVIHREDLIRVLLDLAESADLDDASRAALRAVIGQDQNDTPGELLQKIQKRAMELEAQFPDAAKYLWHTEAIVEKAGGHFVAGIMGWFDQMSNNLSEVFTQKARQVTVLVALAVAFLLPLDSIDLLRRLATDPALTAALVTRAQQTVDKYEPASASGDLQKDIKKLQELKSKIDQPDFSVLPAGWWSEKLWSQAPGEASESFQWGVSLRAFFGVLLSAALMSLGAPFWFDMLKNLLKLKPALATQEEKDRQDRAASKSPNASASDAARMAAQLQTALPASVTPEAGVFGNATVAPAPKANG